MTATSQLDFYYIDLNFKRLRTGVVWGKAQPTYGCLSPYHGHHRVDSQNIFPLFHYPFFCPTTLKLRPLEPKKLKRKNICIKWCNPYYENIVAQ